MNDVWALVPVKAPEQSKSRLLSVLQPEECALLSRSMLMDVLGALGEAHAIDRIAVLTDDAEVAGLAQQLGHHVIADTMAGDLCDGLNYAARQLREQGAATALIIPGDIPTVAAADIDGLIERHTSGLSLCPAIRDGGTNALVCSPPDGLEFKFGNDSARLHLAAAEQAGLSARRLAIPAFFRDIDLPDDLIWLLGQESGSNTVRFLRQSGIAARLSSLMLGASA